MRKNLQSFYYLCPINLRILKIFKLIIFVFLLLLSACTVTKFVPQKQYLLDRVEIKSDQRGFDAASLAPYIHQKPNSKWFSMFRIPLAVYSVSGRDTSRWINRRLQKIGEKPVIFDTLQARLSCVPPCRISDTCMRLLLSMPKCVARNFMLYIPCILMSPFI